MGRNTYKDRATRDTKLKALPIIRHVVSSFGGIHRLKYGIRKDSTYKEDVYALEGDCA